MRKVFCLRSKKPNFKISIFTLIAYLLSYSVVFAASPELTPQYEFSKIVDTAFGSSVAIDEDGNTYVTGHFTLTSDFGTGDDTASRTSAGSTDIFLTKYDKDGTRIWTKTFGGTGADYGYSVTLDPDNNIYLTGNFSGTVNFGAGSDTASRISAGFTDVFVTKYTNNGDRVWTKTAGGAGPDFCYALLLDEDGNIYATGNFFALADFGAGEDTATRVSAGNLDIFLTKYSNDGARIWTKTFGGTNIDLGGATGMDKDGNLYLTGGFLGTLLLESGPDSTSRPSAGDYDIFLAKYSEDGARLWTKTFGGTGTDIGGSVKIDSEENVYITGNFSGTIVFGTGSDTASNTSTGYLDMFVSKYTTDGDRIWTRTIGGTGLASGYSLELDNKDRVYLTGGFSGVADFDADPLVQENIDSNTTGNVQSSFLTSYDSAGNYLWTKYFTGGQVTFDYVAQIRDGSAIAIKGNDIYINGVIMGETDLQPDGDHEVVTTDTTTGAMFLTKYVLPQETTEENTESEDDSKETSKCEYSSPDETTWIKLESIEKDGIQGMNLTWTQYSANKINIKIDDGTGKYPWKITETINDGHEFLPNVASWQNIQIKPINHCKEGSYGEPVSLDKYPGGWFNL